jgi:RHS repeat-associated protein
VLKIGYDYLVTGEMEKITENPDSAPQVLITFDYNQRGLRKSLMRGNGLETSYSYDVAGRLDELLQNLAGTSNDLNLGFTYNPASQIFTNTRSNDAYSFVKANGSAAASVNGRNQLLTHDGAAIEHDDKGNLTKVTAGSDVTTYAYTAENMLKGMNGTNVAQYDPLLRLHKGDHVRFGYDGLDMIAEYDANGVRLRRHVFGPGIDEPLVTYEGSGVSGNERYLHADERGSIVAITDANAAVKNTNTYDEYGVPGDSNGGRFQYTGQAWLGNIKMYHYKARMMNPYFGGRFMQADPLGWAAGANGYGYAAGDPVNQVDPSGLTTITVVGTRLPLPAITSAITISSMGSGSWINPEAVGEAEACMRDARTCEWEEPDAVVVGRRKSKPSQSFNVVALYRHYLNGNGMPICFSEGQVRQMLRGARPGGQAGQGTWRRIQPGIPIRRSVGLRNRSGNSNLWPTWHYCWI